QTAKAMPVYLTKSKKGSTHALTGTPYAPLYLPEINVRLVEIVHEHVTTRGTGRAILDRLGQPDPGHRVAVLGQADRRAVHPGFAADFYFESARDGPAALRPRASASDHCGCPFGDFALDPGGLDVHMANARVRQRAAGAQANHHGQDGRASSWPWSVE